MYFSRDELSELGSNAAAQGAKPQQAMDVLLGAAMVMDREIQEGDEAIVASVIQECEVNE